MKPESSQNITALPVLATRKEVLFPGVSITVHIGRPKSVRLINDAMKAQQNVLVLCQLDPMFNDPEPTDMAQVGCLATIDQVDDLGDSTFIVSLTGTSRARVLSFEAVEPYMTAAVEPLADTLPEPGSERDADLHAIILRIVEQQNIIARHQAARKKDIKNVPAAYAHQPGPAINYACCSTPMENSVKLALLAEDDLLNRGLTVLSILNGRSSATDRIADIHKYVPQQIDEQIRRQQRAYAIRQEIQALQQELYGDNQPADQAGDGGEQNFEEDDISMLTRRAEGKKWNDETRARFDKELDKLRHMNQAFADYQVQFGYLQTLVDLPWGEYTADNFDLAKAQHIIDRNHYGMEKAKERILEYLAVLKMKGDMKSPIICLYGPPGVGKTSLGRAIAETIGRKYVRVSFGGVNDESEIRGHRKTYVGAMPGRIISNLAKCGSSNPVFILDEVDKLGSDSVHGDPSSALLEVLDPEQNSTFHDNYLDLDYDLSHVLFVATANDVGSIPSALRDRMEMIEVTGYVAEEKVEIATRHLIPQELEKHGLAKPKAAKATKATKAAKAAATQSDAAAQDVAEDAAAAFSGPAVKISRDAVRAIIDNYTHESGVRGLDKQIAKIMRRAARRLADAPGTQIKVTKDNIGDFLGTTLVEHDKYDIEGCTGVVTGLAWTQAGGEILFIETALNHAKEAKLSLTGNLGDVMKESAALALEYIKSHTEALGVEQGMLDEHGIHLHVPEGATPKDGPSAGITILTAMVSSLTGRQVRPRLAMSGEITLRGKLLPVGGVKEKILAAKRAGIKDIILSTDNRKDIDEINDKYITGLTFHFMRTMQEALDFALM